MKHLKHLAKVLSLVLIIGLALSFAACDFLDDFLGGSLELESFSVDRSTIKTSYYIGDEIDFTNIKAYVKYNDNSLDKVYTYDELIITYDDDITATTGSKTVTVSFEDPNFDNELQSTQVLITVSEDPNAVKHMSYKIDSTDVKKDYLVGDTVDFTGIKVSEIMTDNSVVAIDDLTKLSYEYDADTITSTTGNKTIAVKYDGENAGTITIKVEYPEVTDKELDLSGVKTEYLKGEDVDFDGLSITLTYENGKTETVNTFNYGVDLDTVTDKVGEITIIASYTDPVSSVVSDITFNIKVDGIVGYSMDTKNVKKDYYRDDEVSFAGISVIASYHFGKTVNIAFEDLTFVHDADLTAESGTKEITVKHGDAVVGKFAINVGDIHATATPDLTNVDLSYRIGETVSLEGLAVKVTYDNGDPEKNLTLADFTVASDISDITSSAGTKQITLKYADAITESDVIVYVDIVVHGITGYEVIADEMKAEYIVGDTLDYTGLSVLAVYSDGGEKVAVDVSGLTFVDAGVTASAGNKVISVKLGDDSIGTINVKVVKNRIVSTVVGGEYKNVYEAGDATDFEGLIVTVTYLNGNTVVLSLDKLTITAGTEVVGDMAATVKFYDEVNGEDSETSFVYTVIKKRPEVSGFEKPADLVAFDKDNKGGTLSYGDAGFSGEFITGGLTYTIGDDNDFKLVPSFSITEDGIPSVKYAFYMDVEISLHDGTSYELLTRVVDENNAVMVSYYHGSTLIVTVNTYTGTYDFSEAAVGGKVEISVLPSASHYILEDINPVVLEAKIIDAYNIYETWQLAVIDNTTWKNHTWDAEESVGIWNDFKTKHGIAGVNVSGVVLHRDIHVTKNDIPERFFLTTDKDIVYKNSVTGETRVVPAGTKYLKDGSELYIRDVSANGNFVIEGNYFSIDLSGFPLVPSHGVFNTEADGDDYGSDFSNASLMKFVTTYDNRAFSADRASYGKVNMQNISFIGNAARDNWVDPTENLVSAGGLIMFKANTNTHVFCDNIIGNSFFISYFPDFGGMVTANKIKCYDSYQNPIFVWGDSEAYFYDSYIIGAGGPIAICQSPERDGQKDVYTIPVIVTENTVLETNLVGNEIWFSAINATTVAAQIQALGTGFHSNTGFGNFVDKSGKMNIKAVLMPEGSDVSAVIGNPYTSGAMNIGGTAISKDFTNPDPQTYALWHSILTHSAFQQGAPFLTVRDDQGNYHTLYMVTEGPAAGIYDLNNRPLGTDASHAAIAAAFQNADQIMLTQGGLAVVFEYYHDTNAFNP